MNGYFHLTCDRNDSSFKTVFHDIYLKESFVDVTLVADDGQHVTAHKIVLSSASDVLRSMLEKFSNTSPAQSIFYMRGVKYENISSLLDFIYKGEARVHYQMLGEFMSLAKDLGITGLNETNTMVSDGDNISESENRKDSLTKETSEADDCEAVTVQEIKIEEDSSEEIEHDGNSISEFAKEINEVSHCSTLVKRKGSRKMKEKLSVYEKPMKTPLGDMKPVVLPLLPVMYKGQNWTQYNATDILIKYLNCLGFSDISSFSHPSPPGWPASVKLISPQFLSLEDSNQVLESIMEYFGIDIYKYHTKEADIMEVDELDENEAMVRNLENKMPFPLLTVKFESQFWTIKYARITLQRYLNILGFGKGSMQCYSSEKYKPFGWPETVRFKDPSSLRKDETGHVLKSLLSKHFGIDITKYHIPGAED